ncbi:ABC transporter permease [Rhodococcus ruber]|uniref:ABC transporter permease n=1 Tax=Rhodococcus ruber TaxID=1830 RepID=A0ABT4MAU1_9NOCA|nr:ABC transporter permease [Rhodococcus ruber]MCZ4517834.1 ABC transporter permease [Rhodococcus ruber]
MISRRSKHTGAQSRFGRGAAASLALANVRTRWTSFVGAFMAVCLGVGLITMTLLVWGSSGAQVPPRVEGTDMFAVPQQASNESGTAADSRPWSVEESNQLAQQLSEVDGVEQPVQDRAFFAQATRDGAPIAAGDEALSAGHGWSSAALAPYPLVTGAAPRSDDQVVLDSSLGFSVGQQVSILFTEGPRQMQVSGTVDTSTAGDAESFAERGVFVTDEVAARQAPGVTAIGLQLTPDASASVVKDAAAAVVGDRGKIVSGEERSLLEPAYPARERFLAVQLVTAMALLGCFVSMFVVSSTFAFNVAERRREMGLLRNVGGLPSQVRGMVLGEALITGVAGGVVGAAIGVAAAPLMAIVLQRIDVAPRGYEIEFSVAPMFGAIVAGVVVAVAGAWAASNRSAKIPPMEALRSAAAPASGMSRGRWIGGLAAVSVGVVVIVVAGAASADTRIYSAMAATMALTVAATLLAPVVIGPIVRVVTWPVRRVRGAGAMLVRAELINSTSRTAALAAPVIATVAFAVLISGYVATSATAYPLEAAEPLEGQSIVWPVDKPGLTDEEVAQASRAGVVRAALPTRVFVEPDGKPQTVLDGVGWLDEGDQGPENAVVSTLLADKFGWTQGQTIDVGFRDGESEQLTIVAVRDIDASMAGFDLSRDTVRKHDPGSLAEAVFVPQADAPTSLGSGATVYDAFDYAAADYERDSWLMRQFSLVLIILAVGYTAIAVANTAAMSAQGRRGQFAALKLAGGTSRQIVKGVAAESAITVGVGVILGLLVSLPALAAIASGFSASVGRAVSAQVNPTVVATSITACLVLSIGAGTLTAARSLRRSTELAV